MTSYAPRLSSGDHHHFLWLRAESEITVNLPIAPHIERGSLDVTVELSCQIVKVSQELTIEVMPEGSLVHRHTSVLLDLRSRANVRSDTRHIDDIAKNVQSGSRYFGPIRSKKYSDIQTVSLNLNGQRIAATIMNECTSEGNREGKG